MTSTTPRAILFIAGKIKYDVITLPAKGERLAALQKHVGGNIESLVHRMARDQAPFVAYANDNGVVAGLPFNPVAWGTLMKLGFMDTSIIPGAFSGNILLLGKKGKPLTDADVEKVAAAYHRYLREIGEEEPSEPAPAPPPPSPLKRSREGEVKDEDEPDAKKSKI